MIVWEKQLNWISNLRPIKGKKKYHGKNYIFNRSKINSTSTNAKLKQKIILGSIFSFANKIGRIAWFVRIKK